MASEKDHMSIVICGHVDSGKSTTTGRLLFELGGIPEREMEKLKQEADALGKSSFAFAFYMDRQKEERARGVTISCTTKEFFTDKWHYTVRRPSAAPHTRAARARSPHSRALTRMRKNPPPRALAAAIAIPTRARRSSTPRATATSSRT